MSHTAFERIAFVVIERFNMMTLTMAMEPMRVANYLSPEPLFDWDFRSVDGGVITASNGLTVATEPLDTGAAKIDTAIVFGSWGCERHVPAGLVNWLRRQARDGVRLVAAELGVYALARAGLLRGKQVTTHWSCLAGLAERYPDTDAREQLYTLDGQIATCAGGTAGADLMLHLIATHHGQPLAAAVAEQMLHHAIRTDETAQRQRLVGRSDDLHPQVRAAVDLVERNLTEPLTVPEIAAELAVSQRQLERLFKRDIGCSVVQFGQLLRLQYARVLLTSTDLSIREVSAASGFNSLSYFSQAFSRRFGRKPSAYRRAWPADEPAPSWPGAIVAFMDDMRGGGLRTSA